MLKFAILLTALAVCYGQRTTYTLYNNANLRGTPLPGNGILTDDHNFAEERDTIILIHGHLGESGDAFNRLIRSEILTHRQNPEYNVIEVDWKADAGTVYATASGRVTLIADELVTFISGLTLDAASDTNESEDEDNLPTTTLEPTTTTTTNTISANLDELHLVGFGLGAHAAGMASRRLGANKVGRITGLDPAGSGWGTTSGRLTKSDADYVEVIHTDDSGLLANGIGTAIGGVNFYVNGGSNQPGCFSHSCSHNRAYELFAASLSNPSLVGYPCSTMAQMNLNRCRGDPLLVGDTQIDKTGITAFSIYRINTRRSWPF